MLREREKIEIREGTHKMNNRRTIDLRCSIEWRTEKVKKASCMKISRNGNGNNIAQCAMIGGNGIRTI